MDVGVGQEGMRAVGVGLGRKIKSAMPKRPTPRRPASPRDRRVIDVSAHDDSSIFFFFISQVDFNFVRSLPGIKIVR